MSGFSKEELAEFETKRKGLLDGDDEGKKPPTEKPQEETPPQKSPSEGKTLKVEVSREEMKEMLLLRAKIQKIYAHPTWKANFQGYKKPLLAELTLDELQAEYAQAQNIARGGGGGGLISNIYFMGNQTVETIGVQRGFHLQGMTRNASQNAGIMTNLNLLDIEFSGMAEMSPAMGLLMASLGNVYMTINLNKNAINNPSTQGNEGVPLGKEEKKTTQKEPDFEI